MKKILSILLVLAMALSLAACGGASAPAEEKPADVAMQYIKAEEADEIANQQSCFHQANCPSILMFCFQSL